MLIKLLRNLQRKSPVARNGWSLFFASSFTGIITIIWFINIESQDLFLKNAENNNSGSTPFSNLLEQSKEQLANIKSSVDNNEVESLENNQTVDMEQINISNLDQESNKRQDNSLFFELSTTTLPEAGNNEEIKLIKEVLIATTSVNNSISPQFQQISTSTQQ